MLGKIFQEFAEKPLGSIFGLVGIIGFIYSLFPNIETTPPLFSTKIDGFKYIIILLSAGIGVFFSKVSVGAFSYSTGMGFVITVLCAFFMGLVVGDLLKKFGFLSDISDLDNQSFKTGISLASTVFSGLFFIFFLSNYTSSINKEEEGLTFFLTLFIGGIVFSVPYIIGLNIALASTNITP